MNTITRVNNLNDIQKAKLYNHYYVTQLGLKYHFEVIDTYKRRFEYNENRELEYVGWGVPKKEVLNTAYYYPWIDLNIMSFDDFYSEKRIEVRDCGEDWQQFGFAQRYWTEYYGAYDWFVKFENVLS